MQGFGLPPPPQKSSSLAVWTDAATWMETSPVPLSTPSFVPYSLMAATSIVLAMSQARVCPCASSYRGERELSTRAPPTSPSVCLC